MSSIVLLFATWTRQVVAGPHFLWQDAQLPWWLVHKQFIYDQ